MSGELEVEGTAGAVLAVIGVGLRSAHAGSDLRIELALEGGVEVVGGAILESLLEHLFGLLHVKLARMQKAQQGGVFVAAVAQSVGKREQLFGG